MTSPTQRTLARLRDLGYQAEVTEKWNDAARIRQDLFGFIDVLAITDGTILAVQATASGVSTRVQKIVDLEAEKGSPGRWLRAGGRIEVWGWARRRAREKNADGKRTKRMEVRLRRVAFRWDAETDPPCLVNWDPENAGAAAF